MNLMSRRTALPVGLLCATLGLTACDRTSTDPVYTQFYSQAGGLVDDGAFGNASMNNHLVQTGQQDAQTNLARRFASEVTSTVNFAFNSATLDANAQAALRQQAGWIKQFPEVRFRVYGHTDAVGSNRYNKRLGQRRANAVVSYLVSHGISRSRLEAVVSFGETKPLVPTQSAELRNRRTVTEVNGFVQRHPTVMDGKYGLIIYRDYVASAVPASTLSSDQVGGLAVE